MRLQDNRKKERLSDFGERLDNFFFETQRKSSEVSRSIWEFLSWSWTCVLTAFVLSVAGLARVNYRTHCGSKWVRSLAASPRRERNQMPSLSRKCKWKNFDFKIPRTFSFSLFSFSTLEPPTKKVKHNICIRNIKVKETESVFVSNAIFWYCAKFYFIYFI